MEHNGSPIIHPGFSERYRIDAGETGIGSHKDHSNFEYSSPLPIWLIGSSSTLRELYGLEKLLKDKGKQIAKRPSFVFDSANAVKILTKGGSGKKDLANITKEIFNLLQQHGVDPVYAWVPREHNKRADELSKRWDQAWSITDATETLIRRAWPSGTIICNRFNTIGWFLRNRIPSPNGPTVLVYPHWPGQAWWPSLMAQSTDTIHLGPAHKCFLPLWHLDKIGVGIPNWPMHATLLT
jgi:hypothetical protein